MSDFNLEDFEEFDGYHRKSCDIPTITITVKGVFTVNKPAMELIGCPQGVTLLFNREKRIIGLRAKADQEGKYSKVKIASKNYMVFARSFCNVYDIDTSVARRYNATLQGGMLLIDLNKESSVATGPRRSRE